MIIYYLLTNFQHRIISRDDLAGLLSSAFTVQLLLVQLCS